MKREDLIKQAESHNLSEYVMKKFLRMDEAQQVAFLDTYERAKVTPKITLFFSIIGIWGVYSKNPLWYVLGIACVIYMAGMKFISGTRYTVAGEAISTMDPFLWGLIICFLALYIYNIVFYKKNTEKYNDDIATSAAAMARRL